MHPFTLEPDGENSKIHYPNYRGRGHRAESRAETYWNAKEFIAWDGEGTAVNEPIQMNLTKLFHYPGESEVFVEHNREPQPYVLFANSKGQRITDRDGLSTIACLEFVLSTKQQFPDSIFVGFGFDYDVNQILKDLHKRNLWSLHNKNWTYWNGYAIRWFPKKYFWIGHKKSKRTATIYDTFGFFQSSFLAACRSYLGKDDPDLDIILKGKEAREGFTWEELDNFIIPYNNMELSMLVRIMNLLRTDLHNAGIDPGRWYGPGAVANKVLAKFNVPITRDIPEEIQDAAQFAYAGGRFEQFYVGRHAGTVYEYDIRSAYPAAASQLPDLSDGSWEHVKGFQPDTFGIWHIEYWGPGDNRPRPLFLRSENGTICYPNEVSGWYWTPEANLCPNNVREGFVFHPNSDRRPFDFIEEMYEARREYKRQGISTERALKLVLNCLYGKLAQTVGGKSGPPRWHQLEWAGYITSATRAKIYQAMQLHPSAIIAAETDAVFSTLPLDLPLSNKLGDWEETTFDSITYLQSGFYYATKGSEVICKYRGMDRDRETQQPLGLPYRAVLDHLYNETGFTHRPTPALRSYTTRFIGLGLGLRTESVWRTWERKAKIVSLDQRDGFSKRIHIAEKCDRCDWKQSMYECLHPLLNSMNRGMSYARYLPWKKPQGMMIDFTMDPEWRDAGEDYDRWQ